MRVQPACFTFKTCFSPGSNCGLVLDQQLPFVVKFGIVDELSPIHQHKSLNSFADELFSRVASLLTLTSSYESIL